MIMVGRVGHLLDELTARYNPANAHLTRINILSLERALGLRRMVIAKMQEPPDEAGYKLRKQLYDARGAEIDSEAQAARTLINAIIEDPSTPSDNAALGRIDSRIDSLVSNSASISTRWRESCFATRRAGFRCSETQSRAG